MKGEAFMPSLDIQTEIAQIKKWYEEGQEEKGFNLLLLGEMGSGKTYSLKTAPKPVHIDCFDPTGSGGIRDLVNFKDIIVDTRFEKEDPFNPSVFTLWEKEFKRRREGGYFEGIGTYCLDSATTWSTAIMNQVLKTAGIPGQSPRWEKDWMPQKTKITNYLTQMLTLPCNVVVTGHLEMHTDGDGGKHFRFMTTGKASVTIPLLFGEVWIAISKATSGDPKYSFLTRNTGLHVAKSRLAANGLLKTYEDQDYKAILKKVGMDYADKNIEG